MVDIAVLSTQIQTIYKSSGADKAAADAQMLAESYRRITMGGPKAAEAVKNFKTAITRATTTSEKSFLEDLYGKATLDRMREIIRTSDRFGPTDRAVKAANSVAHAIQTIDVPKKINELTRLWGILGGGGGEVQRARRNFMDLAKGVDNSNELVAKALVEYRSYLNMLRAVEGELKKYSSAEIQAAKSVQATTSSRAAATAQLSKTGAELGETGRASSRFGGGGGGGGRGTGGGGGGGRPEEFRPEQTRELIRLAHQVRLAAGEYRTMTAAEQEVARGPLQEKLTTLSTKMREFARQSQEAVQFLSQFSKGPKDLEALDLALRSRVQALGAAQRAARDVSTILTPTAAKAGATAIDTQSAALRNLSIDLVRSTQAFRSMDAEARRSTFERFRKDVDSARGSLINFSSDSVRLVKAMEAQGKTQAEIAAFNSARIRSERDLGAAIVSAERAMKAHNAEMTKTQAVARTFKDLNREFSAYSIGLARSVTILTGLSLATFGRQIFETGREMIKFEAALRSAFGKEVKDEMDFLIRTADKMGASFQELGVPYARLQIAAKATGLSMAEVKDIFEGVVTASVALGLRTEEVRGTVRAFEQIISKGRVQYEELRLQLGDRLPGAVTLFARAWLEATGKIASATGAKVSTQQMREFDKAMMDGAVTAQAVLPIVARLMREEMGEAAKRMQEGVVGAIARVRNAFAEFTKALFDAGLERALVDVFNVLSTKLRDPAFIDSMTSIAVAFANVASAVIANAEVLTVFAAIFGGSLLIGGIVRFGQFLANTGRILNEFRLFLNLTSGVLAVWGQRILVAGRFLGPWGLGLSAAGAALLALNKAQDDNVKSGEMMAVDMKRRHKSLDALVEVQRTYSERLAEQRRFAEQRGEAPGILEPKPDLWERMVDVFNRVDNFLLSTIRRLGEVRHQIGELPETFEEFAKRGAASANVTADMIHFFDRLTASEKQLVLQAMAYEETTRKANVLLAQRSLTLDTLIDKTERGLPNLALDPFGEKKFDVDQERLRVATRLAELGKSEGQQALALYQHKLNALYAEEARVGPAKAQAQGITDQILKLVDLIKHQRTLIALTSEQAIKQERLNLLADIATIGLEKQAETVAKLLAESQKPGATTIHTRATATVQANLEQIKESMTFLHSLSKDFKGKFGDLLGTADPENVRRLREFDEYVAEANKHLEMLRTLLPTLKNDTQAYNNALHVLTATETAYNNVVGSRPDIIKGLDRGVVEARAKLQEDIDQMRRQQAAAVTIDPLDDRTARAQKAYEDAYRKALATYGQLSQEKIENLKMEREEFARTYAEEARLTELSNIQREAARERAREWRSLWEGAIDRTTDIITDFVLSWGKGTDEMKRAVLDMSKFILSEIFKLAIIKPFLESLFGSSSGGGGLVTTLTSAVLGFIGGGSSSPSASGASAAAPSVGGTAYLGPFAMGAAFRMGTVIPFQHGGIVSQPTLFPMLGNRVGLMGEKDEEAIFPLTRTAEGKLGVRAQVPREAVTEKVEVTLIVQTDERGARAVMHNRGMFEAMAASAVSRGRRNR